MSSSYPKRLIEVDLPIKRISAHARREKSIRHGHISTLHIWWARRPLAACRAVICAALWLDPVDENCPVVFRKDAAEIITNFAKKAATTQAIAKYSETWQKWQILAKPENQLDIENPDHLNILRYRLLDFIADFANWDNSTNSEYLETSRALTQAAHEALGGIPGTKPLVVDPFAGGGAIPLEALRVGADAFASDLNPVAVLLNKVVLEYIPKYGKKLAEDVRKWGQWVKEEAEKELGEFYPKDTDGSIPVAYLWARTVKCEGPNCGTNIPLIGNFWLSKQKGNSVALSIRKKSPGEDVELNLLTNPSPISVPRGLTAGNSVTCPHCNYTTPVKSVRSQLSFRNGGTDDAYLLAVVTQRKNNKGKQFRLPTELEKSISGRIKSRISQLDDSVVDKMGFVPSESCPPDGALGFRFQKYGIKKWRDLYTPRQLYSLCVFSKIISSELLKNSIENDIGEEKSLFILSLLSLAVSKMNDKLCSLCRWKGSYVEAANGGENKMPMLLDFAEANPFAGSSGDWLKVVDWILNVVDHLNKSNIALGVAEQSSAQNSPLPNDSVDFLFTDPPYYDAFGYSDLSEFFYIWLRRSFPQDLMKLNYDHPPKIEEAISIGKDLGDGRGLKDERSYADSMTNCFNIARGISKPTGVGTVVFANKTTAGWEAILQSLIDAGWTATASWPIDTERPTRQRAIQSAALNSSVHIVCRPRENPDGTLKEFIGDWRDVLQELPQRIHEWLPRLAAEGVVGADAIFACLGPALEVFSRYSSVEKASGEQVTLKEYLEYVWAAVSKEALSMIFEDADATGFEEDARITAMWLWTLSTATSDDKPDNTKETDESDSKSAKSSGFTLEFDAARKIAQGLGVHLENLSSLIEVKKDKARLLPVAERARQLLTKENTDNVKKTTKKKKKEKSQQLSLFEELGIKETEDSSTSQKEIEIANVGKTVLDRIHQTMLLFAAGRGEGMKRFLVEEGIGSDPRFWKLAQALSALYPVGTDEKRWVDGVLARKKGLGF